MAIPLTGLVTLSALQIEFGGTDPVSINEYYRGGLYVPNTTRNASIPTSGAINFQQFRGSSRTATVTVVMIGGGGGGGAGRADDNGAGYGLYATSGGNSTVSGAGVQTITATGASGGYSYAYAWNDSRGAGESSFYGAGGTRGQDGGAGSAASTSYGAGGGGGDGDAPGTFDSAGNRGQGGLAAPLLTTTVEIVYGTVLTITLGSKGLGHNVGSTRFNGGNGAGGYCQIFWDGNQSFFTASGTLTLT